MDAAAVVTVLDARKMSLNAASRALARSLGIAFVDDGHCVDIPARDEVELEVYVDALEFGREAGMPAAKIAALLGVHQQLWRATAAGVDATAAGAHGAHRDVDGHSLLVTTEDEAFALAEALLKEHAITSFSDPAGADTRFSLDDLTAIMSHMTRYGFLQHLPLYQHAMTRPQRRVPVAIRPVVETPCPWPPLSDAEPAATAGGMTSGGGGGGGGVASHGAGGTSGGSGGGAVA